MVHINTDKSNSELHHVYLRGAKVLRPDIGSKGKISVAIDGPAGAGKSSVAKKLAERLGYIYIDTGAMYRTVGVYGIEKGIDIANEKDRLISELDNIKIEINYENGIQRMYLNGSDVTGRIRENDASMAASAVAVIPEIRERLVAMQQEMAKTGGVIMDGRDIGTKVLPNAELKIYLTASVENRAMRRYKEYVEKGEECDFEAIKADVIKRDYNDTHRAASPLVQADDAILVDTSDMNFEESVAAIEKMIKNTEVH
ncbi:MAG: (d)CMP kinase [Oscillospiraceae bacterium]|nr:(d)CMP kinase [Oscillospiraceae bacterium]